MSGEEPVRERPSSPGPQAGSYLGDKVYFGTLILNLLLAVVQIAKTFPRTVTSGELASVFAFGMMCYGLTNLLDLWLASHMVKNRRWAFVSSLSLLLFCSVTSWILVPHRSVGTPAPQNLPLVIAVWTILIYRVVYLLGRLVGLGPRPQ